MEHLILDLNHPCYSGSPEQEIGPLLVEKAFFDYFWNPDQLSSPYILVTHDHPRMAILAQWFPTFRFHIWGSQRQTTQNIRYFSHTFTIADAQIWIGRQDVYLLSFLDLSLQEDVHQLIQPVSALLTFSPGREYLDGWVVMPLYGRKLRLVPSGGRVQWPVLKNLPRCPRGWEENVTREIIGDKFQEVQTLLKFYT